MQSIYISTDSQFVTKNSSGNIATSLFTNPYRIPNNARKCSIHLRDLSVVNFFQNITSAKGNNIIYFTNDIALPQKYTITLPDGAYSDVDVNNQVKNWLVTNGFTDDTVRVLGDTALQKIVIEIKNGFGIRIPSGIHTILGYTSGYTFFNNSGNNAFYVAQNKAEFNTVLSLIVDCSLVSSNFFNGQQTNALANVPINASIGSLIVYNPSNPLKLQANDLIGSTINNLTIKILDQQRRDITILENWNATITIDYE